MEWPRDSSLPQPSKKFSSLWFRRVERIFSQFLVRFYSNPRHMSKLYHQQFFDLTFFHCFFHCFTNFCLLLKIAKGISSTEHRKNISQLSTACRFFGVLIHNNKFSFGFIWFFVHKYFFNYINFTPWNFSLHARLAKKTLFFFNAEGSLPENYFSLEWFFIKFSWINASVILCWGH